MAGEWERLNQMLQAKKAKRELYASNPTYQRNQQAHSSMADNYYSKLQGTYDNEELSTMFDNFKNYYEENLSSMDDAAIDRFQFVKDDFVNMFKENADFANITSNIESFNNRIKDNLMLFDGIYKSDVNLLDEKYSPYLNDTHIKMLEVPTPEGLSVDEYEDAKRTYKTNRRTVQRHLQDSVLEEVKSLWRDFGTEKLRIEQRHADRLQISKLGGEGGISGMLASQEELLQFVWDSAKDDYLIDSKEWEAYNKFMDTGNYDYITDHQTAEINTKNALANEHLQAINVLNDNFSINSKANFQLKSWLASESLEPLNLVYSQDGQLTQNSFTADEAGYADANALMDELDELNPKTWAMLKSKDEAYHNISGESVLKYYRYDDDDTIKLQSEHLSNLSTIKKRDLVFNESSQVDDSIFKPHPDVDPSKIKTLIASPDDSSKPANLPSKKQMFEFYGVDEYGNIKKPQNLDDILQYIRGSLVEFDELADKYNVENKQYGSLNPYGSDEGADVVKKWLENIFVEGQRFFGGHNMSKNKFNALLKQYFSAELIGDTAKMAEMRRELEATYKEMSIKNTK